jgi:hypothetical protein
MLLTRRGSGRLFISKTEIHFERKTISDHSREYGKSADMCDPEKDTPGLFPEVPVVLGEMHQ